MWKVLICDDDILFLEAFKKCVKKVAGKWIQEIKTFEDKDNLEFYIAEHSEETYIILLDVDLGKENGVETAQQILSMRPNTQIIFISGYDRYYLDVYEVEHAYFLKKPIDEALLEKALKRAGKRIDDIEKRAFVVSNKKGIQKISLSEILYFEKEKRKIHVHTKEDVVTYYGKFEDMIEQLDDRFLRCHNSYIINVSKVKKLSGKKFFFENEGVVPISKSYYQETKKAFLDYVGGDTVNESVRLDK